MMKRSSLYHSLAIYLIFLICLVCVSCQSDNEPEEDTAKPEPSTYSLRSPLWERSTDLYLVDIGSYTPEGSFQAFLSQLPDLKKQGVQTIVLRQICPIGFDSRNEPLKNPSAVSDFTKVNPDYGSFEDFRELTQEIRDLRMHLLIEWEPNHTSWDHSWLLSNPEWYVHIADTVTHAMDAQGRHTDMLEVAELDYGQTSLRSMMIEAMRFWIRSSDIDGFLVSHANLVPEDFWDELRPALDQIKPTLLVANPPLPGSAMNGCFQGYVDERWTTLLSSITQISSPAEEIRKLVDEQAHLPSPTTNPVNFFDMAGAMEMGVSEQVAAAMFVINATLPGINMVQIPTEQSGPQPPDGIDETFYLRLFQLKHYNEALWNGIHGGPLEWLTDHKHILAFRRHQSGQSIVTVVNCSGESQESILDIDSRNLSELFTGGDQLLHRDQVVKLQPWEYRVYANPSIAL